MKTAHFVRLEVYLQSTVGEIELLLILSGLSVVCKDVFSCLLIKGELHGGNLYSSQQEVKVRCSGFN